ncbi:SspB family protein [Alsobacter sp. R-9]
MPQDLIRYDLLVQDALKGVVRKVLTDAAEKGLPGDHHFYVSFRTDDPGLRMSQRLREKYPEEMTIILQHQFWDLAVTEHAFEVGLSFSGIPERLLVPFDALTGFFDPSVQFGLKFELSGAEPADNDEDEEEAAEAPPPPAPLPLPARAPASESRDSARKAAARAKDDKAEKGEKGDAPAGKAAAADAPRAKGAKAKAKAEEEAPGAEVVSLDAFRKKP